MSLSSSSSFPSPFTRRETSRMKMSLPAILHAPSVIHDADEFQSLSSRNSPAPSPASLHSKAPSPTGRALGRAATRSPTPCPAPTRFKKSFPSRIPAKNAQGRPVDLLNEVEEGEEHRPTRPLAPLPARFPQADGSNALPSSPWTFELTPPTPAQAPTSDLPVEPCPMAATAYPTPEMDVLRSHRREAIEEPRVGPPLYDPAWIEPERNPTLNSLRASSFDRRIHGTASDAQGPFVHHGQANEVVFTSRPTSGGCPHCPKSWPSLEVVTPPASPVHDTMALSPLLSSRSLPLPGVAGVPGYHSVVAHDDQVHSNLYFHSVMSGLPSPPLSLLRRSQTPSSPPFPSPVDPDLEGKASFSMPSASLRPSQKTSKSIFKSSPTTKKRTYMCRYPGCERVFTSSYVHL
jgi:hypothetical protein